MSWIHESFYPHRLGELFNSLLYVLYVVYKLWGICKKYKPYTSQMCIDLYKSCTINLWDTEFSHLFVDNDSLTCLLSMDNENCTFFSPVIVLTGYDSVPSMWAVNGWFHVKHFSLFILVLQLTRQWADWSIFSRQVHTVPLSHEGERDCRLG